MDSKFSYDDGVMLYRGEDIGISSELIQDMMASEYRGGKEYIDYVVSELESKYQRIYGWKVREQKINIILS